MDKRKHLFAAASPLEAKQALFSLWVTLDGVSLDFIDVATAGFHARAWREAFVDLPAKDDKQEMCELIRRAARGARDAEQTNEMTYADMGAEV